MARSIQFSRERSFEILFMHEENTSNYNKNKKKIRTVCFCSLSKIPLILFVLHRELLITINPTNYNPTPDYVRKSDYYINIKAYLPTGAFPSKTIIFFFNFIKCWVVILDKLSNVLVLELFMFARLYKIFCSITNERNGLNCASTSVLLSHDPTTTL